MQLHLSTTRIVVPAALAVTLALAACGGSDSGDDAAATDAPTESSAGTENGDATSDSSAPGSAAGLGDAPSCLEDRGFTVVEGDETSTGLTADMMENFGIDEILVFTAGDGSAGTIEAYASPTQAELAAEGYEGSPLGYQVGSAGDVVFKTTGSPDVLTQINGCLEGG